jgi:hypothetical protein
MAFIIAAVSSLKRLTLKHCRQLEASSMLMLTEGAADRDDDEDDEFDVPVSERVRVGVRICVREKL